MKTVELTIEEKKQLKQSPHNNWVIIVEKSHQYALGVTGVSRHTVLYIDETLSGYPYAAAAYKDAKDSGIKNNQIKGNPTPYGNLGEKITLRRAEKLSDYLKTNRFPDYAFKFVKEVKNEKFYN